MLLVMIAAGGALGALARYSLGGWVQGMISTSFPLGTMVVNILGSFLLGLLFYLLEGLALTAEVRSFLTIGLLGAFTTFSTFSYEALVLVQGGEWGRGGLYIGGSVLLGLAGVLCGLFLGSFILHARG
jgi:CrcB protein